jgi:integrase
VVRSRDSVSITIPVENKEASGYKSFSKKQLQEFQEVETWLKNVGKSSQNVYLSSLRKLCNWCGKNPHELITQRDQEIRNEDPTERNGIRDLIIDFRHHLESQGYAPKTINAVDGAIRSFFTSVLGRAGMVNLRNYKNASVRQKKDLVPTLEELKKMLDVVDLEEKFRILFIAQTGMRVSDAVALRIGDIRRELELNNVPMAIRFIPKKDRELIGERITFLGSDGFLILKEYLRWREKKGEELHDDSPLFVGRSKKRGKGCVPVTQQNFNETIRKAAKRIGLVNGDAKYGRMRVHCLRKFFIT